MTAYQARIFFFKFLLGLVPVNRCWAWSMHSVLIVLWLKEMFPAPSSGKSNCPYQVSLLHLIDGPLQSVLFYCSRSWGPWRNYMAVNSYRATSTSAEPFVAPTLDWILSTQFESLLTFCYQFDHNPLIWILQNYACNFELCAIIVSFDMQFLFSFDVNFVQCCLNDRLSNEN